ncbi:unnamed protein product [Cunninghamella blakesleeana]
MTKLFENGEPKEEEKVFNLVLVDIWKTYKMRNIKCVKKSVYDSDLKYIAISYRWGEMQEQLLETLDYTAHITSFLLGHLINLCYCITQEPDLKGIRYLWVDAISVDQQNHARKKETILKMNQIYEKASYILAVPDLHRKYLLENTANREVMELIYKYKDTIYHDINHSITTNNYNNSSNNSNNNNNNYDNNSYNNNNNYDNNSYNNNSNSSMYLNNNYNINNSNMYYNNYNNSNPTFNSIRHSYINHHPSIIQKLNHKNMIKENEVKNEMEELRKEIKKLKKGIEEKKKDELKKAYQFLAYLIEDWSNRVWVISEYQIAKEKYMNHRTPLKYIFTSLLWNENGLIASQPFFSYTFASQHESKDLNINNATRYCKDVNDSNKFIHFLKSRFVQQNHIDMIVASNASRNEGRFYAILPSWDKYQRLIKNKNTISNWKITDMLSVKLKLYEIMNDNNGDLWDKAGLLYYCSIYNGKPVLPSFATYQQPDFSIPEIAKLYHAHKWAMHFISKSKKINGCSKSVYEKKHGSIFKQNLIDIQFNKQERYLSIKAEKCFHFNMSTLPTLLNQEELSKYSLADNYYELKLIYIPYFTYNMADEKHPFPVGDTSRPILSGTLLIGNMNLNKWILYELWGCKKYDCPSLCSTYGYTYKVY